jgi:hypothetical protein
VGIVYNILDRVADYSDPYFIFNEDAKYYYRVKKAHDIRRRLFYGTLKSF